MSRIMVNALLIAGITLFLGSCEQEKPAWTALPLADGLSYQVFIKNYKDGSYADQPFELKVESTSGKNYSSNFMTAIQCKSVKISQTKEYIYIFYDEIVVTSFSSVNYSKSMPRPLLCDLNNPSCKETLETLRSEGKIITDACTHS